MKDMLEKLIKESEQKEACIKLQEETIAKLTEKFEKHPTLSLVKSSKSEQGEKMTVQSEAFNEDVLSKKHNKLKKDGLQV